MKKIILIFFSVFLIFSLTACGESKSESSKANQSPKSSKINQKQAKINKAVKKASAWQNTPLGKIKALGFGYSDELGINGKKESALKPVKYGKSYVTVQNIAFVEIKPNDKGAKYFNTLSNFYAVMVSYEVKNGYNSIMNYAPSGMGMSFKKGNNITDNFNGFNDIPALKSQKFVSFMALDNYEKIKKGLLDVPAPSSYKSINVPSSAIEYNDKNIIVNFLDLRQSVIKDKIY